MSSAFRIALITLIGIWVAGTTNPSLAETENDRIIRNAFECDLDALGSVQQIRDALRDHRLDTGHLALEKVRYRVPAGLRVFGFLPATIEIEQRTGDYSVYADTRLAERFETVLPAALARHGLKECAELEGGVCDLTDFLSIGRARDAAGETMVWCALN